MKYSARGFSAFKTSNLANAGYVVQCDLDTSEHNKSDEAENHAYRIQNSHELRHEVGLVS